MRKIILSALVLVAMASCSKTESDSDGANSNAIVFGSDIEASTKVRDDAATAFENGEKISVYGYRIATAAPTTDFTADLFLNKIEFTFDGTKFASASTDAVWKMSKAHNFYAFYPTTLTVTNSATGATAPLTVVEGTGIAAANDVMIAKAETPVFDGAKKSAELKFQHKLSKVRFKIRKELADAPDSKLTNVEFKMASNAASVNLVTGTVTNTPGSITMSRDLTATPINVNAATPIDVPGNWMVLPLDQISDMVFTLDGVKMRVVNTNSTLTTEVGKFTTITIVVKADGITFTSSIQAWGNTNKEVDELEPESALGPIIEYGETPYDQKGPVTFGSTTSTYNGKYGAGASNGTYRTTAADAYENEKPYYKFEVAKTNAYSGTSATTYWQQLQGSLDDRSDNICVQQHGIEWRMPRLSELVLIYENRAVLNNSGDGFVSLEGETYWAATEISSSHAWNLSFANNQNPFSMMKDEAGAAMNYVRCIRELPPTPGPIIEYGKSPYQEIGAVTFGTATTSYNDRYGKGATNSEYLDNLPNAYEKEKPYGKFEVAKTDVSPTSEMWTVFQGTLKDHSDNMCVQVHGAGWRIPRISELQLIYQNKTALEASGNEFESFFATTDQSRYWAATENNELGRAWYIQFDNGSTASEWMQGGSAFVRCIREVTP